MSQAEGLMTRELVTAELEFRKHRQSRLARYEVLIGWRCTAVRS
jgi:hypothetical protein